MISLEEAKNKAIEYGKNHFENYQITKNIYQNEKYYKFCFNDGSELPLEGYAVLVNKNDGSIEENNPMIDEDYNKTKDMEPVK